MYGFTLLRGVSKDEVPMVWTWNLPEGTVQTPLLQRKLEQSRDEEEKYQGEHNFEEVASQPFITEERHNTYPMFATR